MKILTLALLTAISIFVAIHYGPFMVRAVSFEYTLLRSCQQAGVPLRVFFDIPPNRTAGLMDYLVSAKLNVKRTPTGQVEVEIPCNSSLPWAFCLKHQTIQRAKALGAVYQYSAFSSL